MVHYSKHLSLLKIFSEVVSQADKVLVWAFLGAAPMAAYVLAQLPVKQLQQVFSLIFTLTFSKVTTAEFSELKKVLPHKVRSLLALAGVIVLVYIFAAPFLFTFLFPAYPESVLVSQVLALTLLSRPRALYGQAFAAHKKKREMYITEISGSAVRIIFLLILLPLYGLWGVVYALLATHLYINVVTRYLFARAK
jgi:O-antigen/teichoic acid export membrane protein